MSRLIALLLDRPRLSVPGAMESTEFLATEVFEGKGRLGEGWLQGI